MKIRVTRDGDKRNVVRYDGRYTQRLSSYRPRLAIEKYYNGPERETDHQFPSWWLDQPDTEQAGEGD